MQLVEMGIDSVRRAMHRDQWVMLLKDKSGERYLPIYTGSPQANSIIRALKNEPFSESIEDSCGLPHIATLLPITVSASVTISRFEDDTYHAKLSIEYRGRNHEIECQAPKALALGIRAGAQIFVDESVLDKTIAIPSI